MPAQKKHSTVRRRTNKASTATELEPRDDDEEIEVPDLPPRRIRITRDDGSTEVIEIEWCQETLDWWEDVWASPMSDEYLDADVHGLIRLAVLVDNYWRAPDAKAHAEVRLAQKDYGLTPYDRRRLEWTIAASKKAKKSAPSDDPPKAPGAPQPDPTTDPRLTLVK
jgi:hypothetical protein